jgi:hypothetical protein
VLTMQFTVSFPGSLSLDELEQRINILKGLGAVLDLSTTLASMKDDTRKRPGRAPSVVTAKDRLTEEEILLLDQALALTHNNEEYTPLMNEMARQAVGDLKPLMTEEVVSYYKEHPGQTIAQGAAALADKFVAQYDNDITLAFNKIRNLIRVITAKTRQRVLEARGEKRSWHKPIYVLEAA